MMASLNINSLLAHIDELRVYMNSNKIDALTINETKLDSTIENSEIYLPGFETIRKDRKVNGRNGWGVGIFLRSNINYIMRDDLSSDNLECVIIEITKPRSKSLLLGTWQWRKVLKARVEHRICTSFLGGPGHVHPENF
jgi:hypothetical protein